MPEIQAFRGIRYDLGRVGSLSDVVCPPYDVISPQLQEELYRRHPYNFVRLELNRIDPTDDEANNRYTRAGRLFRQWLAEGVLFTEADPAIYVYHQEFSLSGQRYLRRGFMARMRLSRFGEGIVFPHEETMSGPKWDRYMLTAVCKANLSQIFGLYPDPQQEAQAVLEEAIADQPPLEAVDHLGVVHRMWPVTKVKVISRVSALMGPSAFCGGTGAVESGFAGAVGRIFYASDGRQRSRRYRGRLGGPGHPASLGSLGPLHPAG
jgi:uncharacterized protein (DUF1015 family)